MKGSLIITYLLYIVLGVIIMFNPFATVSFTVMLIGISIIISGLGYIWNLVQLRKLSK